MKRTELAQTLSSRRYLTFPGTETYLLFLQKYPLRDFCAFEIASDDAAYAELERGLLRPSADAAADAGYGLITDAFTWRASPDYVERLGFGELGVAEVNARVVARARRLVDDWRGSSAAARECPVIVSGDLGPRGDGYAIGENGPLASDAARAYHAPQIRALAEAGVDLLFALTMTSVDETLGVIRAADDAGLPVLVSATVETDGKLPDGSSLGRWIETLDAKTSGSPLGYMVNCAHPEHVTPMLRAAADESAAWLTRFRGLRANASTKSHEELDNSTELDRGDPTALGRSVGELAGQFGFTIVGGCCGTDAEHLRQIAAHLPPKHARDAAPRTRRDARSNEARTS